MYRTVAGVYEILLQAQKAMKDGSVALTHVARREVRHSSFSSCLRVWRMSQHIIHLGREGGREGGGEGGSEGGRE